ncbi:hypothetical protein HCU40_08540 [Pseudanabaena biceps]|nr:hypothetical protein [Pseudanabaena biceps]
MSLGQSRNTRQKNFLLCCLSLVILGIVVSLHGCLSNNSDRKLESNKTPVAVFLFLQASPDGSTIEGIVPSDLVERSGSLDQVIQSIPVDSNFDLMQFGKSLTTFSIKAVRGGDAFGAIASFKLQAPKEQTNPSPKIVSPDILKQPNLTIVPHPISAKDAGDKNTQGDRSYFFNCPNKIQPLVLAKSRDLFIKLGAKPTAIAQVTIASIVCADIDGDNQPEIIAGLRLDNAIRPVGFDPQSWQGFLSRSALERQEYSILVMLKKIEGGDWQSETILTNTRSLSYINDSVSSYALHGLQELNGDHYPELIVKEIGLNSLDVKVISPSIDAQGKWQWSNYYQNQRSLNIVQ